MVESLEKLTLLHGLPRGGRAPVSFQTTIIACHDGDSCALIHSDGVSDAIRMCGIDAPELLQPAGNEAQKALADFVLNKQVTVETRWRDGRGRLLGRILINNIDINLQMLKFGMAWAFYLQNVDAAIRPNYQAAFDTARANKTGIFANGDVIEPCVWRKSHGVKI